MNRIIAALGTFALVSSVLVVGPVSPARASVPSDGTYDCNTGLPSDATPNFTISAGSVSGGETCVGAVVIPEGVISFAAFAFYAGSPANRNWTSITFPDSLTSTGLYALAYATNLTTITFPANFTSIGEAGFYNTQNLCSVYFLGNAPSVGADVFKRGGGNCDNPQVFIQSGAVGFPAPGSRWEGYYTVVQAPSAVTFDPNSGSGAMANQTAGGAAALTSNAFDPPSGFTFTGWNTAADGSGIAYADGASYDFSANLALYAQWAAMVTFDSNSGSGTMANQTAGGAAALTSNAFDPPSGFTFTGWNTAADGSGIAYADGASYDFSANLALYAQWAAVAAPPPSSGGGTSSGSVAVQSDPAPTRAVVVVPRRAEVRPPAASPAAIQRTQQSSGSSQPAEAVALVGGEEVAVKATTRGSQAARYGVGKVTFDVGVAAKDGALDSVGGVPSLKIARHAAASVKGAGFQPGSSLQVFLPAADGSFIELPSVEVRDDGSFEGSLSFGPSSDGKPMPIGTRYLQMAGIDEDGRNTVLDMPVTVAQPPSGPELDRRTGERPALEPGKSMVLNAGEPEDAAFSRTADGVTIGGDSWAFSVRASSAGDAEDESLAFTRDMPVSFTGSGFMPGTRADVWLFSDPILLGSVNIADDGSFQADFAVDSNFVPTGDHTLQIQGVGDDGFVRAAHLGVVVEDPAAVPVAPIPGSPLNWTPIWLITGAAVLAMLLLFAITASLRGRQGSARVVRPAF